MTWALPVETMGIEPTTPCLQSRTEVVRTVLLGVEPDSLMPSRAESYRGVSAGQQGFSRPSCVGSFRLGPLRAPTSGPARHIAPGYVRGYVGRPTERRCGSTELTRACGRSTGRWARVPLGAARSLAPSRHPYAPGAGPTLTPIDIRSA